MKRILCLFVIISFVTACKKETETLIPVVTIADLYPLAVGQTFTYRLDSTITQNFGASLTTVSYQAKDTIESNFLDASGRNSFRIFRYLRDTAGTQPWFFAATYYATITSNTVEFNDNNSRFITLANPVSYNNSWKGNSYINTGTSSSSPLFFFYGWDYHYDNIDMPFNCQKGTLQNTCTIIQQDSQDPITGFDPTRLSEKKYSIEVYAKGVGLIYKEFLHYEWQVTPAPKYLEDRTYGVKLNLIDYK